MSTPTFVRLHAALDHKVHEVYVNPAEVSAVVPASTQVYVDRHTGAKSFPAAKLCLTNGASLAIVDPTKVGSVEHIGGADQAERIVAATVTTLRGTP